MKRLFPWALSAALLLTGCQSAPGTSPSAPAVSAPASSQAEKSLPYEGAVKILLSDDGITVDGQSVSADPAQAVYTAHDIVFYPTGQDLTFGEGTEADAHEQSEADGHTVVHITKPGTYVLSGKLSAGQIAVDLGEDAEEDPSAVVTLVLNGADITCTVAPGVIFYNVYECGDKDTPTRNVDTSAAGANVIIADDTTNYVSGSYVARIYKPGSVELSEDGTEVVDSKKLHKYDAAFYSKMSMNVDGGEKGTGLLNITAENEGLDSELHLTINGGSIAIQSGNDGINTNEDGVSVTTINDGTLSIAVTGTTGEGDGIDSNGWLVINGGTVLAAACSDSGDAGIDSDMGIHINGGTVMSTGNMLDHISESDQTFVVFQFSGRQSGKDVITMKNEAGEEVFSHLPVNDYSYYIFSSPELTEGTYTLWSGETQLAGAASGQMGGPGGGRFPGGKLPEGMDPPEDREKMFRRNEDGTVTLPDGTVVDPTQMKRPEGTTPPEMPEDGWQPGMGGGRPGGNFEDSNVETSAEFVIRNGENYFTFLSPVSENT